MVSLALRTNSGSTRDILAQFIDLGLWVTLAQVDGEHDSTCQAQHTTFSVNPCASVENSV